VGGVPARDAPPVNQDGAAVTSSGGPQGLEPAAEPGIGMLHSRLLVCAAALVGKCAGRVARMARAERSGG
jgi:hypothetical protein